MSRILMKIPGSQPFGWKFCKSWLPRRNVQVMLATSAESVTLTIYWAPEQIAQNKSVHI